jgi:hypothetical protein
MKKIATSPSLTTSRNEALFGADLFLTTSVAQKTLDVETVVRSKVSLDTKVESLPGKEAKGAEKRPSLFTYKDYVRHKDRYSYKVCEAENAGCGKK